MQFGGNLSIDLLHGEIINFGQTGHLNDIWEDSIDVDPGFHFSTIKPKYIGKIREEPHAPLNICWISRQTWSLLQGQPPQTLQSFQVNVITLRPVSIEILAHLMLRDNLDPSIETKIENLFSEFDPATSGDVDAFISAALAADNTLSVDQFYVAQSHRISITGQRDFDHTPIDNMIAILNGTAQGQVAQGPSLGLGPWEVFFPRQEVRAEMISSTDLSSADAPPPDPHETEFSNPQKSVEEIVRIEAKATDCSGFETKTYQLGWTKGIPQTHVHHWAWRMVKIGCCKTKLFYPKIETRQSKLVLTGYITIPNGYKQMEDAITECLKRSGTTAIVLAIAFTDISTALTTFKSLFWDCIKGKFNATVPCLNAGLSLDTEPDGDWK